MKIDFFLEKNLKISSRTGQLIVCDNSLEKKVTEKSLWEYDLYIERLSVHHKSVRVCQWDLSKKYVQKSYFPHL